MAACEAGQEEVVTEFRNMIASLQPSLARSAVEGEQAPDHSQQTEQTWQT